MKCKKKIAAKTVRYVQGSDGYKCFQTSKRTGMVGFKVK